MASVVASATSSDKPAESSQVAGLRKNGKHWHEPKRPFRPNAGQTSYAKRVERQAQEAEVKKLEREMKAEKEDERQVCGWFAIPSRWT